MDEDDADCGVGYDQTTVAKRPETINCKLTTSRLPAGVYRIAVALVSGSSGSASLAPSGSVFEASSGGPSESNSGSDSGSFEGETIGYGFIDVVVR